MKRRASGSGTSVTALSSADEALIRACTDGDVERAAKALADGAHLEIEGIQRPLFLAATRGHARLFRWLLDRGANLSIVTSTGHTPFFEAIAHDQVDIVTLCLDAGLAVELPDASSGRSPLMAAVGAGAERVVSLLLQRGGSPSTTSSIDGSSSVHAVGRMPARSYSTGAATAILGTLIAAGANVAARDARGETVLHVACRNDNLPSSMLELLLGLDVAVDATDEWGSTALWVAARCNRLDLVTVLLSRGANPNARTTKDSALAKRETSVYEVARERGDLKLLSVLRDAGATGPQAAGPTPPPADPFRVGGTVTHARFGAGEVIATEGAGADRKLTIRFEADTKMLLAKFVVPAS